MERLKAERQEELRETEERMRAAGMLDEEEDELIASLVEQELYCLACKKSFKTKSQYVYLF
jgi:hypothetical protein